MKDITSKDDTLREAIAEVYIDMPQELITILQERKAEKGDALELARAAAALAAKKTWDLIPFCHPIPLTHVGVKYEFLEGSVRIITNASPAHIEKFGSLEEIVVRQAGEYVKSIIGHGDGMFPLRGQAAVLGDDRPAIRQQTGFPPAEVDHRFNGKHHAGNQ